MFRQNAPPMNFFLFLENSRNVPTALRDFKSMDLFPQQAGFGSSVPIEEAVDPFSVNLNALLQQMILFSLLHMDNVKKSSPGEPQKAQMTIFCGGQVIVFNRIIDRERNWVKEESGELQGWTDFSSMRMGMGM